MEREKSNSAGCPDPHALQIAAAAQEAVGPDLVILFGSRAVGDHREDSDVDILVVTGKEHSGSARAAAERAALPWKKLSAGSGRLPATSTPPCVWPMQRRCETSREKAVAPGLRRPADGLGADRVCQASWRGHPCGDPRDGQVRRHPAGARNKRPARGVRWRGLRRVP